MAHSMVTCCLGQLSGHNSRAEKLQQRYRHPQNLKHLLTSLPTCSPLQRETKYTKGSNYLSENNRFFKRIKAMNLQLLPDTAERIIKEILDKCETAYAYTWVRYHTFGYNRYLSYQQILNARIDVAENEVIPFIQTRLDNMTDEYKLKLLYKYEEYKATVAGRICWGALRSGGR